MIFQILENNILMVFKLIYKIFIVLILNKTNILKATHFQETAKMPKFILVFAKDQIIANQKMK